MIAGMETKGVISCLKLKGRIKVKFIDRLKSLKGKLVRIGLPGKDYLLSCTIVSVNEDNIETDHPLHKFILISNICSVTPYQ